MAQENSHLSSPTGALPTLGTGAAMLRWVAHARGPLSGLVVLCVLFASTSPVFLSVRNALNIIDQVTVLGILAIGMTAVIVIGGIDLSVGAILALATMTIGSVWRDFAPPFVVCIALGLVAGALAGLVNGLPVTRARLPAFIATLTMMSVARLAGIRARRLTVLVYVASGLLSAIAGVVLAARLDSAGSRSIPRWS
jgi:ribose transport system permease protein